MQNMEVRKLWKYFIPIGFEKDVAKHLNIS